MALHLRRLFGRRPVRAEVVVPDEVPGPWEPYVRPTHAVGLPVERPRHQVVPTPPLPRRPDEPVRVRTHQPG